MLLIVGRIGKPHGIRGEVTVEVRTDEPDARFAPGSVLITEPGAVAGNPVRRGTAGGSGRADDSRSSDGVGTHPEHGRPFRLPERLTVEAIRWHQGRLLVCFEGILDRDVAEALRGTMLWVDSSDIPAPTDPEEFHDHQLVGLTVVDTTGERLGEVARIDHAPASDLLVLRRPEGRTALIPFIRSMVPEVDLAGGRIVVDPPAGLLDL